MKIFMVFKEKGEYYELDRNVVRISWDKNSVNYISAKLYSASPKRISKIFYNF